MPTDLQNRVKNSKDSNVWLSCSGVHSVDAENIGPLQYYPDRGYPGFFFPYSGQKDYLEPVVAVQFERPMREF